MKRISRKALVVCIVISLLITLVTGWYPQHGGGPGSSGANFGIPISWRIKRWASSTPHYDLIEVEEGRFEQRLSPWVGNGKTRTFYRLIPFSLDVAIWSIGLTALVVIRNHRRHTTLSYPNID